MKKNIAMIFFILVLGFTASYFYNDMGKIPEKNETIERVYADSIKKYQFILDNIVKYQEYESRSNGISINPDILLEHENDNFTTILDALRHKTLIFRFTESNCTECMEKYFFHLKGILDTKDIQSLILIGNFSTKQNMQIFNQIFEVKWTLFNYQGEFGFPIEDLDLPYFFVVDEKLVAYNFRIAIGTSAPLIESYLNGIAKR